MPAPEEKIAPVQPPTLWEKMKIGVKGFFKTAVGYIPYIPKALLITGVFMLGASMLAKTGFDPLGMTGITPGQVLARLGISAALGMGIAATMGACGAVSDETKKCHALIAAQKESQERGSAPEPKREREKSYDEPITMQRSLPKGSPLTKPQQMNFIG